MPASRFRTQRCARHGLAMGLCEDRTCPGWNSARVDKAAVPRVESPRCQGCGQRRGDAIPRDLPTLSKDQRGRRFCEGCLVIRQVRAEAREVRAKFVTPYRRTAT